MNRADVLFAGFHQQRAVAGYVARAGQMIDATFIEVPRRRNTPAEDARIKSVEKAKRR